LKQNKIYIYLILLFVCINSSFALGSFDTGSSFAPTDSNITYLFTTEITFEDLNITDDCMILSGGNNDGVFCFVSSTPQVLDFPLTTPTASLVYRNDFSGNTFTESDNTVVSLITDNCGRGSWLTNTITECTPISNHTIRLVGSDPSLFSINITSDLDWGINIFLDNLSTTTETIDIEINVSDRSFETHWIKSIVCDVADCTTNIFYWDRPEITIDIDLTPKINVDQLFLTNITYNTTFLDNTKNFYSINNATNIITNLISSTETNGRTTDQYAFLFPVPTNDTNITLNWNYCLSFDSSLCNLIGSNPWATGFYFYTEDIAPDKFFNIRVLDAATNNLLIQEVRLTLQNTTDELNFTFSGGLFNLTDLNFGTNYNLIFNSTGFNVAIYNLNIDSVTMDNGLDAYMDINNTISVSFNIIDTILNEIPGARISIEKFINGTRQIIGIQETDATGLTIFELEENVKHFLEISKPGFVTNFGEIDVNKNEYTIKLSGQNDLVFKGPSSGIVYDYNPKSFTLEPIIITFNFSITTTNNDLLFFNITILGLNGTILQQVTSTSISGGLLQSTINLLPFNNTFIIDKYSYQVLNEDIFTKTVMYNIKNTNLSFSGDLNDVRAFSQANFEERDKIIIWAIALIIIIIVTSVLTRNILLTTIVSDVWMPFSAWFLEFNSGGLLVVGFFSFVIFLSVLALTKDSEVL